jgi:membrane protease YdiL (CAAX protease family)
MFGLWIAVRLNRREVGFRIGRLSDYAVAVAYPIVVIGTLAGIAWLAGDVAGQLGGSTWSGIGVMFAATFPGVLISEEGFFRGTLWGLGRRAGWSSRQIVGWTSITFAAWHIAVPLIEEPFRLPPGQLGVYLVNATLLGLAWGLIRLGSGSMLVACMAHAVWNALVYTLFGYGPKSADLGVSRIGTFDPERGVLGLVANALVVAALLLWLRSRSAKLQD